MEKSFFKIDSVVGRHRIYSVWIQSTEVNATKVLMVALKRPEAAKGGELQRMTLKRSTMIVTVTLLGKIKRCSSCTSSSTVPDILELGGSVKIEQERVCFVAGQLAKVDIMTSDTFLVIATAHELQYLPHYDWISVKRSLVRAAVLRLLCAIVRVYSDFLFALSYCSEILCS